MGCVLGKEREYSQNGDEVINKFQNQISVSNPQAKLEGYEIIGFSYVCAQRLLYKTCWQKY